MAVPPAALGQTTADGCDCDAETCVAYDDELHVEGTALRRRYVLRHPTLGRMPQEVYVLRVSRPVCGCRNLDGRRVDVEAHVREMVIGASTGGDPLRRLVGNRWVERSAPRRSAASGGGVGGGASGVR